MSSITPAPTPTPSGGAGSMPDAQTFLNGVQQGAYGTTPTAPSGFTGAAGMPVWLGGGEAPHNVNEPYGGKPLPDGTIPDQYQTGGYLTSQAGNAYQLFWGWDQAKQDEWMKLIGATDTVSAAKAWAGYVDLAAQQYNAYANGNAPKPLTPWDLARGDARRAAAAANTSRTYHYSSSQTYSPTDMQAYADAAYQRELGRDATPGEIAGVSPTTTTSETRTSKTSGGSSNASVSESTSRADGANVQQELINQAKQNPHYAEYQAATTYMNALMQAIGEI